jgi:heavy metal sensor kinase
MTIRLRLTLWYTALLGATLILFSVLVYALLAANLWAQVRQTVGKQANDITSLLTQQLLHQQRLLVIRDSGFGFPDLDLFISGSGAQVIGTDGSVYLRSQNLGKMEVPYHNALPRIQQGAPHTDYGETSNKIPFLVYSQPFVLNKEVIGAVQIVRPIDSVENTLNQVSRYLILGTALSLVLAAIVGALIAHRALAPIGAITDTAGGITRTGDLGQRLQITDAGSEVGQLAATFNEMLDRIQRLFNTQERLIADVSHELRTPLTTMQGNVELLQRMFTGENNTNSTSGPKGEVLRETLSEVEQETHRMSKMINDLLLLAQADSGALQLQWAPVEMDTLLLEIYRQTKRVAELRKGPGALDVRLGHEDQALVWGDRERLRQLLLNLTDNAIKYTPEGGTVTLSLTNEEGWVCIAVRDTGIGIHSTDQEQIFERFYRTDKARSREMGGSGLGLSIVQWIAQAHNGRVTVESEVQQGSTFTLWLPELGSASSPGNQ